MNKNVSEGISLWRWIKIERPPATRGGSSSTSIRWMYLSQGLGIGAQLWFNRSQPDGSRCARGEGGAGGFVDRVNFARRRACEISSPSLRETACVSECSDRPRNIAFVENCDSMSRFPTCSPKTKLKRDVLTQRRREGALHFRAHVWWILKLRQLKFGHRKIDVATATCLPS